MNVVLALGIAAGAGFIYLALIEKENNKKRGR